MLGVGCMVRSLWSWRDNAQRAQGVQKRIRYWARDEDGQVKRKQHDDVYAATKSAFGAESGVARALTRDDKDDEGYNGPPAADLFRVEFLPDSRNFERGPCFRHRECRVEATVMGTASSSTGVGRDRNARQDAKARETTGEPLSEAQDTSLW